MSECASSVFDSAIEVLRIGNFFFCLLSLLTLIIIVIILVLSSKSLSHYYNDELCEKNPVCGDLSHAHAHGMNHVAHRGC